MDDLDKRLTQLQLLNSRELTPKSSANSGLSIGGVGYNSQILVKKVGPAVPPKPKKLQSQQSASNSMKNDYSNMKMTLDNPEILKQKLEALEHHKRVLENQQKRRMQLNSQASTSSAIPSMKNVNIHDQTTKSSSAISDNDDIDDNNTSQQQSAKQQQFYENINHHASASANVSQKQYNNQQQYNNQHHQHHHHHHQKTIINPDDHLIYSNIVHPANNIDDRNDLSANTYSNVSYADCGANILLSQELPPPPPPPPTLPQLSQLNLSDSQATMIIIKGSASELDFNQQLSEEDLPPPPSPVSSSYSELRRATDNIFSPMPPYHNDGGSDVGGVNIGGGGGGGSGNGVSQMYQRLNNQHLIDDDGQQQLLQQQQQQHGHHHHHHQQQHHNDLQQTYSNSYQSDYGLYVPNSQISSTYESIYEPINPRPSSQLSSRSNYSLYTPYINGGSGNNTITAAGGQMINNCVGGQSKSIKSQTQKEVEVDALTNLLVRSMDNAQDLEDNYGICVQCGERVVGESSGCTAMEQIYHITCFTCCQCQINLQGKPFYALDGKPCCEDDYLNTLEKCSVCMKPILERILRATGKPYHPGCFCCVVCGKSLDGVPFTVDATNQNHCIEDFHKKFAPRCCVCRQPIMPEPGKEETVRVVALDRSFHVSCYKCEDCSLLLSSEAEGRGCFPLDDHILCKSCNAKRVQALTSHMTTEL